MRAFLSQAVTAAGSDQKTAWTLGLPHGLAALASWPVFGASACVTGLVMASLALFVVYLPMTALLLNGGQRRLLL